MKSVLPVSGQIKLPAAIVIGIVFSVAVSVAISHAFVPFNTSTIDSSNSRTVFDQACAGCHSLEAGRGFGLGPNLHDIGKVAKSRIAGMHALDYIAESILYPSRFMLDDTGGHMPEGLVSGMPVDQVKSLIAFLASRGSKVDLEYLEDMEIDTAALESKPRTIDINAINLGYDLFFNKLGCSGCHAINEVPGGALRAPSLAKAGLLEEKYLAASITDPSDAIAKVWRIAEITHKDGSVTRGRVLSEKPDNVLLLVQSDNGGGLLSAKTIPVDTIDSLSRSNKSPMPAYTLTIRDQQALVAFLRTLIAGN